MKIYPVVLCGGSGTRLWPMSRGGYPKQYLKLTGDRTLVQQTAIRLQHIPDAAAPIIVTNNEQRFLVAEQLRQVDVTPSSIVLEPVGRNTAPAIAIAALLAMHDSPDALLLVLPSDHVILNEPAFIAAAREAATIAADKHLVTFGIMPTEPHTGFGYIRRGPAVADGRKVYKVDAFVEKPDAPTAERFVADGNYYWNSGMFMLNASTYMEELHRHAPEIARQAELALSSAKRDNDFLRLDADVFAASPNVSIDYAVMEKTARAAVVAAADLGWNDIGSWSALAEIADADAQGNALIGDIFADSVKNSYIRAEHRMVAAIGLDNIVIVETADAVLVAHRDKAQDVKKIVEWLNASGRHESVTHRRVVRPWGSYEGIDQGERFQVKRIVVNPGAQLSLQMHHHRAEHWIVVKGTALVTNGDKEIVLTENQSTYIPLGATHRLKNPGKIPLELIEVQSGAYLGEDDIVRFEDTYGRAATVK
ncbi:mannose-1-phosphate guanylyltransferase/mannose-6-phosphate isomerase [Burkholderia cenocepacia]|uniref:mannose-1-phosphate guanylyltransferase/mannose-6-phosphate isomerase n=1 Tax=Burkholderia cenocepacia TaxID=95486 RepID=UPI001AA1370E|nr:mannose-1-phosphate guanylyltransferase/mannose-6-phosphate isomerase [Burkholderia cenocepacia]MBO1855170.1 mannose-1-phosphate guanylyltransferase/mannose-6-phosphate isomerase [Burkholderia cenocepacia]MBR8407773.1 mannose-1-phosphate guanylyltransferase/mannose-6-phosphate isomerase [Burkholderia cenocepacia]MDR5641728.1 mannose-1-phosphate guanylyltransferase/mannose-6-phosphate isomerase [Burkholderia cenocepacia]MDR8051322.1 mannose-1-phosphate guanylyltransferase/mannose-6-phosphate 